MHLETGVFVEEIRTGISRAPLTLPPYFAPIWSKSLGFSRFPLVLLHQTTKGEAREIPPGLFLRNPTWFLRV